MQTLQRSWIQFQHPPTQKNLRGGGTDEAVLNKVQKNNICTQAVQFNAVYPSIISLYLQNIKSQIFATSEINLDRDIHNIPKLLYDVHILPLS